MDEKIAEGLRDPLVLQYASSHPNDLAGQLSGEELPELAAFLGSLPRETTVRVAARLPSWHLTALLRSVPPEFVRDMLLVAPIDDAVAIVAHLPETRYQAVMASCAPSALPRVRQLFEFPSHSVAALATTRFVRALASTTCGDFAERLSNSTRNVAGPVLVVEERGIYVGILGLQAAYARRNRSRLVSEVAARVPPLSGETDASTALSSRLWMRHVDLPVVDRKRRLLGVVNRATLLNVAEESASTDFSFERLFTEMATGYLTTCGRVLESILGKSQ